MIDLSLTILIIVTLVNLSEIMIGKIKDRSWTHKDPTPNINMTYIFFLKDRFSFESWGIGTKMTEVSIQILTTAIAHIEALTLIQVPSRSRSQNFQACDTGEHWKIMTSSKVMM